MALEVRLAGTSAYTVILCNDGMSVADLKEVIASKFKLTGPFHLENAAGTITAPHSALQGQRWDIVARSAVSSSPLIFKFLCSRQGFSSSQCLASGVEPVQNVYDRWMGAACRFNFVDYGVVDFSPPVDDGSLESERDRSRGVRPQRDACVDDDCVTDVDVDRHGDPVCKASMTETDTLSLTDAPRTALLRLCMLVWQLSFTRLWSSKSDLKKA